MWRWVPALLLAISLAGWTAGSALAETVAPRPPLGWNSWDSYGLTITEAEFRANVDWFDAHLKSHGWRYVVVDEGWYLASPEQAGKDGGDAGFVVGPDSLYRPTVNRFPSAANNAGFAPLARWVHGRGLKFGLHIIRGIPRLAVERNLAIGDGAFHAADAADTADTCRWNKDNFGVKDNAAGQAYYDSLIHLYADWGVDFLKVDCIAKPFLDTEIAMIRRAIDKSGRPILLSLSPGPTPPEKAAVAAQLSDMWRISDDVWDSWAPATAPDMAWVQNIRGQFDRVVDWVGRTPAGHWPDADMLPIGHLGPRPGQSVDRDSALTADEQQSLVTLWAIFRSPLIVGANLTRMTPQTAALLTNDAVLAVNQASHHGHPVRRDPDSAIWVADPDAGGGLYVALFNFADQPADIRAEWSELGLTGPTHRGRNLWNGTVLPSAKQLQLRLPAHGSALLRVR